MFLGSPGHHQPHLLRAYADKLRHEAQGWLQTDAQTEGTGGGGKSQTISFPKQQHSPRG